MANPEHVAKLLEGVEAWNRWRQTSPDVPDLTRLTSETFLSLRSANLQSADLTRADLTGADLTSADLTSAILLGTNLTLAKLRRANLSRALIGLTVFGNADLSGAVGLETCSWIGLSVVDHLTLMNSKTIPASFLRGCGLPDHLISKPIRQPKHFYSCFISFSAKDEDFAQRLYSDLQERGVRCWFAPHSLQSGQKLHQQIEAAIRVHDRLLLILSAHSMNSEWVKTEIANARRREVLEHRQVLFPISLVPFTVIRDWECFDSDAGKDSAREIREYFIPDFSNWQDQDSYQVALDRLLRDLTATGD